MKLLEISDRLCDELADIDFDEPITKVYRPVRYARRLHAKYIEKYGQKTPREVLLVGMNPGPWGMGQTGVPFGDVDFVHDWMGIDETVDPPDDQHPERPIEGLDCDRNEVSGSRLWGWAEERFGPAADFFDRFYVHNYCPLLFLEESGRNRPPSRMLVGERETFEPACNRALGEIVDFLEPDFVVGVGNFARDRIKSARKEWETDVDFQVGRILHPSPASPQANKGWAEQAERQLAELGVDL
jgi:single-strand selective monofunctional uracil DNA glycosylase